MPIYEYKCSNCQHHIEKLENISADKQQKCPECNQDTLLRQISRSHFQLQGKGWYVTDFKESDSPAGPQSSEKNTPTDDNAQQQHSTTHTADDKKNTDNPSSNNTTTNDKSKKSDKSDKSDKSKKSDKSTLSDAKD